MKRREFIKKSFYMGFAAGAGLLSGKLPDVFASPPKPSGKGGYDMVAVKGGMPDVMFDRAIAEFGGMKKFVKPNCKVVVKPNIGWDAPPERAANTNPLLVKQIIKHCFDAGAKDVYVFDHTCDVWTNCYKNSGIENAAKDAGAIVVSGDSQGQYHEVEIKQGKILTGAKVHELILESDVFINVPVLKHHGGADLTIGMKNHMGIIWNRRVWHLSDLHQCIADFATFKKPELTVVDAFNVMMKNGPRGGTIEDLANMKSLIVTVDPVAADSAGAKLFGIEPESVGYIKLAKQLNVGETDLSKLAIKKINI